MEQYNPYKPENLYNPSNPFNPGGRQDLPNASLILIFGIISIPFCCLCGVGGLVFGIIALVMANKSLQLYRSNPNAYSLSSYNNINGGRICAIIGIVLSSLGVIYYIISIALHGINSVTHPSYFK